MCSNSSSFTTYSSTSYTVQQSHKYSCGFLSWSRCTRYYTRCHSDNYYNRLPYYFFIFYRYVYYTQVTISYQITYYTSTQYCAGYSLIGGTCKHKIIYYKSFSIWFQQNRWLAMGKAPFNWNSRSVMMLIFFVRMEGSMALNDLKKSKWSLWKHQEWMKKAAGTIGSPLKIPWR